MYKIIDDYLREIFVNSLNLETLESFLIESEKRREFFNDLPKKIIFADKTRELNLKILI